MMHQLQRDNQELRKRISILREHRDLLDTENTMLKNDCADLTQRLKDTTSERDGWESNARLMSSQFSGEKMMREFRDRTINQCAKIVGDVIPSTECLTVDLTTLVERVEKLTKELDRRKGDPVTRLHNICEGITEPMECGHDIKEWCDVCDTCGACHAEAKEREPKQ